MERLRVCITGSNGFIGRNLVQRLDSNPKIEVIPFAGDLLKKDDAVKFFVKNKDINQIIHLVGLFAGSFEDLVRVNVVTLANLLWAAPQNNIKKIILTSTGAVYGEPLAGESKEDDQLRPNTYYGLSKKYAEEYLLYHHHNSGIEYVILRFPNVYGPENDKGVIHNFISDIKERGEVTINGDGTQSRNFLHVSDACLAIEKSLHYDGSGIFNISNPVKVSINDLIGILKKKYRFTVKCAPTNNNLRDLLLDVSKAKQMLGFEAEQKELSL
ncbi:MAG: NAD(P)-dependent oxidoreductase [Patescibacteria group bacterium]